MIDIKAVHSRGALSKLLIILLICMLTMTGCSNISDNAGDATGHGSTNAFVADENLSKHLDTDIYNRVISEPIGAIPPEVSFCNKDIVCLLNYNGLLIFDIKSGTLKDAIDIQGLGLNQMQGSSAISIQGNDDFLTITPSNSPEGYIYEIESSRLGKLSAEHTITYTKLKAPEQSVLEQIEGIDVLTTVSALESEDGIAVCEMDLNNLAQMHFRIYGADHKLINDFSPKK